MTLHFEVFEHLNDPQDTINELPYVMGKVPSSKHHHWPFVIQAQQNGKNISTPDTTTVIFLQQREGWGGGFRIERYRTLRGVHAIPLNEGNVEEGEIGPGDEAHVIDLPNCQSIYGLRVRDRDISKILEPGRLRNMSVRLTWKTGATR